MMYLSKGVAMPPKTPNLFYVSHCGSVYAMGKQLSSIWRNARLLPRPVPAGQERSVLRLVETGLASFTDEEGDIGTYRLLTNCIPCPADKSTPVAPLSGRDRRIWTWITKAGLRLTTSELIRLEEQQVQPTAALLGMAGRQELTNMIYSPDTICDGLLETMMERSSARDATVASILHLLRLRCLVLV